MLRTLGSTETLQPDRDMDKRKLFICSSPEASGIDDDCKKHWTKAAGAGSVCVCAGGTHVPTISPSGRQESLHTLYRGTLAECLQIRSKWCSRLQEPSPN